MSDLLKSGQTVHTESSQTPCTVEQLLGGGGQGEVYRANLAGQPVALKWYYSHSIQADPRQYERLEAAIHSGAPSDRFLWPIDIVSEPGIEGFGYVMPLREPQYKGFVDLMKRRIKPEPTFRALATAGFELADGFFQLHTKGLCYRDISFGNVFFNPNTGDVLICDNDNVTINGDQEGGVMGTPRFIAPEIITEQARPSTQTDLYSLAVLLFYMLMIHHPLEGKKETEIKCLDAPAMNKLYGTEAVFIFDPKDNSNAPVRGYHDNALAFWPIYPQFLRELFTKAFTKGIQDPENGRVRESEWRGAMVNLRDSIIYCPHCGAENFYDPDVIKASGGKPNPCWSCQKEIRLPPRIRIEKNIIMLNHDTKLFPHHINVKLFDFSQPVAEVTRHPNDPNIWGIKNLMQEKWLCTTADNQVKDVEPGRSATMAVGTKINFGKAEGEIRL
ncbi:MAG: serine/threonine protein kinase [Microcystis panniformis Mp_MB_F_20051200_S9]|uniref:Serine/threonine protein kinase n=1 Tax=Microcystis panniformis Mp_MB_F_20051200_S9 TaxID=2486223 RepID=A0A552QAI9_9CHRO|nr:MAG: serine/threonine protein kinase [Microcystis panniformis Mp_MB_F_20080800_S26D]TRV47853.1 MAG: serine/threonine protein kinase [Microcystis panniformis Mp_GB_SS_20050300_S99]TRV52668.1 MAG: serine/threonine protein kinase [Microcystis panniformis Mp_GB_SS_20050300_S99D]TRV57389.1 MAG: serine/threonine protein kinase [Microcystis panniformis Mp_MB_F_20080800_S26]TRV66228.1 MAG: serine/threonine protein kinase [Microcystis panniformis Mp_MB_F_20051200_S9]TRV68127.1 MAG: serine/threonine 